jgi:hypothetical protein
MWQSNRKTKTASSTGKNSRFRNPIRMKRVPAQMRIPSKDDGEPTIVNTRFVLNDMTAKGLNLFVPAPLMVGQELSITIEYPRSIFLKGRVHVCTEVVTSGRVMSEVKCAYRLAIELIFADEEEAAAVKAFTEELYATVLHNEAA